MVPDRLTAFVWPITELATARTPRWSNLKLMDVALDIERLSSGTSYVKPAEFDWYTVDACLRLLRDVGSRFAFALGLSLQPQEGYSFTDGVDLQIKACKVARSLPAMESKEWLTFLYNEFKLNWMDQGGEHYHAKLRSARPDHEDAQLSEYLPNSSIYIANVQARLRRAEPIADMRVAFPSLLSSESVVLPGTSSASLGRGGGRAAVAVDAAVRRAVAVAEAARVVVVAASTSRARGRATATPQAPSLAWHLLSAIRRCSLAERSSRWKTLRNITK